MRPPVLFPAGQEIEASPTSAQPPGRPRARSCPCSCVRVHFVHEREHIAFLERRDIPEHAVPTQVFANRLRERAAELGIAHAEAARRAGLTERRYGRYVDGIREPDLVTLVRIAEALQTRPDDLLGFGEQDEVSARSKLIGRLVSAAQVLADEVLEIVVVQAEALAASRRVKSPGVKSV